MRPGLASSAGLPAGRAGRSFLRVRSVGPGRRDGRARGGSARCVCATPCGLRVQPLGARVRGMKGYSTQHGRSPFWVATNPNHVTMQQVFVSQIPRLYLIPIYSSKGAKVLENKLAITPRPLRQLGRFKNLWTYIKV